MYESFLSFCQLCNEAFGENISTTMDMIHQLNFSNALLEFCDRDDELFCRAQVGTLNGIADIPHCLEALLSGNYLWNGTNGATLSVKDNTIYLTDRLPDDYFQDSEQLEEYVEDFLHFLTLWRERLELYKQSAEKEVE